jgi:Na+-translocating ferredoxin:NAD+ oxidoreductase RnfG subunit
LIRSNESLKRAGRILTKLLLATFWLAGADVALAEHYLSAAEAHKICFPNADKFEAQQLRLSADQSKTIEQKSGVKVRKAEIRFSVARKDANTIGVLMVDQVVGKHELIDYAVAISPEGKVRQVEILEYREHYGGEIRDAKWREQFKGKTAASKLKLNDDIYNISGATISCRNVTEGVRRVLATFEVVVRPHLLAAGRLQDVATRP